MKILNLYAGIGGNRKLWGDEHTITAVEYKPEIAAIYKDFFPNDNVIVGDAHDFLLKNYKSYDFIWASPPCPTHSHIYKELGVERRGWKAFYPDMSLYQEIIMLKHYFKGKWCVENVVSYYEPLIKPHYFGSHYFWSNFHIKPVEIESRGHHVGIKHLQEIKQFDLSKYKSIDKRKLLRNCVEPELGLHILNESQKDICPELFK